ncbi:rRNA maturation RNase YbeY [Iocasia frigidifontis]|uniref:Endoribonuclease YbeY n=1 Tax=Iocasia fonsfrigidae TaxID=2682810 RepID=A0A8A7K9R1_9FIRM|nr:MULTISPECIES: rRNA maturation RNase YbeY [Halanaerobiaceae]AZO95015.1 rRNA maturation RNase YbeY [Halocella sp. SP3-1]MTI61289.1 rRNA maturation RNase YbeY [Bacillota bacterium]QTL97970.1 rRNA maturation RNase YbeY [Iocasia fonsfrigidae]
MIRIEINNKQDLVELDNNIYKLFQEIAERTSQIEGYNQGEISFALVDNKIIRELNKKYRNNDQATDVLSFPMDEEIWGDIIISTERAAAQAKEYGHSLKRELGYLAVHGIMHLLGYDHKTPGEKAEMRYKEERVLSELNLQR